MATLEHLFRTGELGPIRVGMTESQVRAVLNHPDGWSNGKDPIYKYGVLDLSFRHHPNSREGLLRAIGISFSPQLQGAIAEQTPANVWPLDDCKALSSRTTWTEFREYLDSVGLANDLDTQERDEGMRDLFVPPGGYITFHDNLLYSIHFFEPAPPMKQVSFSVSKEVFERLKYHAQRSKKSVSSVCAEWITQRAGEMRAEEVVAGQRD